MKTPSSISSAAPRASVIIVNYNGEAWLTRCVESLINQSMPDFEAFIIDNGSKDGSIAALPDLDDRFEIIELGENTGFAAANNIGAKRAKADWIALLNPDAFARPDWLENLLAETKQAPSIKMVGSLQYMALEPGILDGAGDYYHAFGLAWRGGFGHPATAVPDQAIEAFGPCGAGALYERAEFLRLDGFDERFFCYHEDVDLAFRLQLAGGRCLQSVTAIIDHVSSGVSGRASDFAVYHGTRNRIWTFFKNMPWPLLIFLAPIHLALNLFVLTWSLFRPVRFKPTFRGMRHGFAGLGAVWKQRRDVQSQRTISIGQLLRRLAWSPVRMYKRRFNQKPWTE